MRHLFNVAKGNRNMNEAVMLSEGDLRPGDVLVGFAMLSKGEQGCETGYSHSAVYLGAGDILESDAQGVQISTIDHMMLAYDHFAVLRASETWSDSRLARLRRFAEQHVGKKFNSIGIHRIDYRKEEEDETSQQQVEAYFAGRGVPVATDRPIYFCSELVVSAFLDVGIIDASAAMLFKPETKYPMDIARDKAFGFFVGYIPKSKAYVIPDDDWFHSYI